MTAEAGGTVVVRPGPVAGAVRAPGSKSHTHRAFLLGAQSEVPSTVTGALRAADTQATIDCLRLLGANASWDARDAGVVRFQPARLRPTPHLLDCRNSGTTLRLLAATVARFGARSILDGDQSLRARPNGPLLDALHALGARTESRAGCAPLAVQGPLRPGEASLPPATSSQFASGLLLSLPFLEAPSVVRLAHPLSSAPYLDLTLHIARQAGLRIAQRDGPGGRSYAVAGGDSVRLPHAAVEGDWSSAAFALCAAAATGGAVRVDGLEGASMQGDKAVAQVLRAFGAHVEVTAGHATCRGGPLESPGEVDVRHTPDLFPALAVVAAVARGTTTFTGGASLRRKESDRIGAMAEALARMGADVQQLEDGLRVRGGSLRGAAVASRGDHRIHMALCVAGLAASSATTVDGAASTAVSYPGFHDDLRRLGARLDVRA
ncbi:MAG TPA: 3-phosphoshikimate 1-carboxyvinyltransferase [Candidatus Thermoplasmatota archaeon]|nr:3-phosphoshikimate 1-carboxyvinyltransferase [Candidatus Thermoplasmatota archaeon]